MLANAAGEGVTGLFGATPKPTSGKLRGRVGNIIARRQLDGEGADAAGPKADPSGNARVPIRVRLLRRARSALAKEAKKKAKMAGEPEPTAPPEPERFLEIEKAELFELGACGARVAAAFGFGRGALLYRPLLERGSRGPGARHAVLDE